MNAMPSLSRLLNCPRDSAFLTSDGSKEWFQRRKLESEIHKSIQ